MEYRIGQLIEINNELAEIIAIDDFEINVEYKDGMFDTLSIEEVKLITNREVDINHE